MTIPALMIALVFDTFLSLTPPLKTLIGWIAETALLICVVLALRRILSRRLSGRARYALWAVVLVRALLPFHLPLSSPLSAAQLIPQTPAVWEETVIPSPFSTQQPIEQAAHYYRGLEPGRISPSMGSMGYVQVSEDGQSVRYYIDLYSPEEFIRVGYAVGVVLCAGILLWTNIRFHRHLWKSRRRLVLLDCPIPVYTAEGLPSPCLIGLLYPAIYLTPDTAADETRLRHVLTHELTHYAQKDHIWTFLRCVCLALHWCDPLMWVAAAVSKRDCEFACDQGAVEQLGESERLSYGRTLVDMVAEKNGFALLSCSTTMTGGAKTVRRRVEALVSCPKTKKAALILAAAVLFAAGSLVFSGAVERPLDPQAEYEAVTALLKNDLPLNVTDAKTPAPSGSGYITDSNLVAGAKAILTSMLRPLESGLGSIPGEEVTPILNLTLHYYEEADRVGAARFLMGSYGDSCYLLRWGDQPGFIPVAALDSRFAEDIQVILSQQEEWDRMRWENPQQGYLDYIQTLEHLTALGIYGRNSGLYTVVTSTYYADTIAQIRDILTSVTPVLVSTEDATAVTGNRVVLFGMRGADWSTRTYYLEQVGEVYNLTILHDDKYYTPIAMLTKEQTARLNQIIEGMEAS